MHIDIKSCNTPNFMTLITMYDPLLHCFNMFYKKHAAEDQSTCKI